MFADPPPAYSSSLAQSSLGLSSTSSLPRTYILSLPLGIQLEIIQVYLVQGIRPGGDDEDARKARRVRGLLVDLRRVSRVFYLLAMNLLRSRYLSAYMSQVRPPFTSDPFPVTIIGQSAQSSSAPAYSDSSSSSLRQSGHHLTAFYDSFGRPLSTSSNSKEITPPPQQPYRGSTGKNVFSGRGRETAIFDRFIALRVGQDLRTAESELCMEGDEERDLFVRLQPAARLEDLVFQRSFDITPACTSTSTRLILPPPNPLPPLSSLPSIHSLPFEHIHIKYTPPRRIVLYLNAWDDTTASISRPRIIQRRLVELERQSREEMLESTAEGIVRALQEVLRRRSDE